MTQENLLAYLLTVSYDGTDFYGWFCPKNRNLQDTILQALAVPVKKILVASRTDRGVHAEGQKILIILEKKNCLVPLTEVRLGGNSFWEKTAFSPCM